MDFAASNCKCSQICVKYVNTTRAQHTTTETLKDPDGANISKPQETKAVWWKIVGQTMTAANHICKK